MGLPNIPAGQQTYEESHAHSDLDSGAFAQHHSLGTLPEQAAPGNHPHFGAWIDLPLTANIVWIGAPFQKPQIRKSDTLKMVQLRGVIRNNTGGAYAGVLATVPVGYRLPFNDIASNWTDSGGVQQFLRLDIGANGTITPSFNLAAGANVGLLGLQWYLN